MWVKTLFPLTIFLTKFPLTIFGTILLCVGWCGSARAQQLYCRKPWDGQPAAGGRANSHETPLRDKNYVATIMIKRYYLKWKQNTYHIFIICFFFYMILNGFSLDWLQWIGCNKNLLHTSEWLLIRLVDVVLKVVLQFGNPLLRLVWEHYVDYADGFF